MEKSVIIKKKEKDIRTKLFYFGVGMLIGDIIGFILFRNSLITITLCVASCGCAFVGALGRK